MKALRCPHCFNTDVEDYPLNGLARCKNCAREYTKHIEARDIFYQLWSKDQSSRAYNKILWNRLKVLLNI